MKSIVFDAGSVISLTMNNLLWILEPLKEQFNGHFYITPDIHDELVKKPLRTKKFKFEALQVMRWIKSGILEIYDEGPIHLLAMHLHGLANSSFIAKHHPIKIVHMGEMEAMAVLLRTHASAIVIDERTTRKLVEHPEDIVRRLRKKLHIPVSVNEKPLKELQERIRKVKVIRSIELVLIAYEMGLLDSYIPPGKDGRKQLLEAVMWGVKLDGCSVSEKEIKQLLKKEQRR
jgi:hypothetical protein